MHFSATVASLSLLAAHASAETIKIDVGENGLKFSPESVKAAKGDTLEFHFYSTHSVAMGDWAKGCTPPETGGFFSGVVQSSGSSENKEVFQVMVNDTKPMAFYCTVADHCQDGMVGVVNPTSDDSLEKYKDTSKSAKENNEPDGVFGGRMVDGSDSGSGSSSTASGSGSQGSSTQSASGSMTSGSMASGSMTSGMTMTTTSSGASGSGASQTTAAQTSSTGAASQLHGPAAGIGALAVGIAAFLV